MNVGGATQSSNPTAFDGSSYFYSGAVASGFAQQTISLSGTANMDLIFGGRIRSAAENPADQGTLILTFLDGSNNPIGSPITLNATNVNDRWELAEQPRAHPRGRGERHVSVPEPAAERHNRRQLPRQRVRLHGAQHAGH